MLLKIPMQMVRYVAENKLFKVLAVYLLLKAYSDGNLALAGDIRARIKEQLGIRTLVSFNKYIKQLRKLNWIGVDEATHTCYVRGFNTIRRHYQRQSYRQYRIVSLLYAFWAGSK